MRSLLIDTTSSFINVSIIEDNNILYSYNDEIKKDMSSMIIPIIDEGFKTVNFSLNDINKIFVVNGPGSFTGIRIGVTIGKTIAWALKKDIIPLSSLELLATTPTNKKYIVSMIDARRGNVFGAIYDANLNIIKKEQLIKLEELTGNLDSDYELVSHDNIVNTIKPNIDIIKIINKHINDKGLNPHNLNPNYLKLTEAEENKLND